MIKNSCYILLVFVVSTMIICTSCDRRPTGVLDAKEMENLMVDLHLLEGSIQASGNLSESKDYYLALFNKYDISQAEFDSCLAWYTVHPKTFERIYINVNSRIETLSGEVKSGVFHPIDSTARDGESKLWNLPVKYVFTKDSARNKLEFELTNPDLQYQDLYELSFFHRLAPSDSSLNPHAVLYVNYLNGEIDSIYTKTKNDSILRKYTMKFKARKKLKIKSISGFILGNDSARGAMNAYVDSVRLLRKFQTFRQDSIRAQVGRADTTQNGEILPNGMPKKQERLKLKKNPL